MQFTYNNLSDRAKKLALISLRGSEDYKEQEIQSIIGNIKEELDLIGISVASLSYNLSDQSTYCAINGTYSFGIYVGDKERTQKVSLEATELANGLKALASLINGAEFTLYASMRTQKAEIIDIVGDNEEVSLAHKIVGLFLKHIENYNQYIINKLIDSTLLTYDTDYIINRIKNDDLLFDDPYQESIWIELLDNDTKELAKNISFELAYLFMRAKFTNINTYTDNSKLTPYLTQAYQILAQELI